MIEVIHQYRLPFPPRKAVGILISEPWTLSHLGALDSVRRLVWLSAYTLLITNHARIPAALLDGEVAGTESILHRSPI